MKIYKTLFLVLLLFLFNYCASTRLTSFKDPDYKTANFKRILILVNSNDLENRMRLESKMVQVFKETGIFALESYNLFPPTRELTDEDKVKLLLDNNIDSFISISVGESGVDEVYIPSTSSTTKTKGNVSISGNTATYKEKSKTTYQGGYTFSKPWAEFETKLYDVSNGRMVWIATSFTGGNALANFNTVINSYCEEVLNKLENEELIPSRKKIAEQKRIEVEKKKKRMKEIIEKRNKESVPPNKSIVYLKNHKIIKGLILSTEKIGETIVKVTLRSEEGEVITLNYEDIEKIEDVD